MTKTHFATRLIAAIFIFAGGQLPAHGDPSVSQNDTSSAKTAAELKLSCERNKFGHHALKAQIHIDAPASLVWDAIRDNRLSDPDVQYSKFTDLSATQRLLEQKYTSLPIFGSTTCVLKLEEDRNKRIDYNLLKSDRLSEFEGSWVLTPSGDERSTTLTLSNHLKLNFPLPQRLIDAFAAPKMKARLQWVKTLAESKTRLQIASSD